jgi:hypothetical protein
MAYRIAFPDLWVGSAASAMLAASSSGADALQRSGKATGGGLTGAPDVVAGVL